MSKKRYEPLYEKLDKKQDFELSNEEFKKLTGFDIPKNIDSKKSVLRQELLNKGFTYEVIPEIHLQKKIIFKYDKGV